MRIQIRDYQPSDYKEVKKNLLGRQNMFDLVWDSEESLNREIEREPDFILVADVNGKAVGNVFLTNWWGHGGWIFHLAVRKELGGQGIVDKLMDEAEKRLKKKGVKEVALLVNVDNKKTREYFAKRGYKDFPGSYKSVVKKL